jgi:hypothetical protein
VGPLVGPHVSTLVSRLVGDITKIAADATTAAITMLDRRGKSQHPSNEATTDHEKDHTSDRTALQPGSSRSTCTAPVVPIEVVCG